MKNRQIATMKRTVICYREVMQLSYQIFSPIRVIVISSLFLSVLFILFGPQYFQQSSHQYILGDSNSSLAPCSSGDLSTSTRKIYQMAYPNETFLQLTNTDALKDVSQLKDLTCLQYLDATDRDVEGDIANLKNLTNLEVLSLYSNPDVSGDICSLAGAINLRVLKFAFDPKITGDISCLKNLTKLETFAMTHTQIEGDISVFANMPNLKAIYVSGTNVKGSICSLKNLTKLEEMGIADEYPGNPDITGDLSCLDALQKLKRVSIYNTSTTNCEQFTRSHSNIAQMGKTDSGQSSGGGCSEESKKTLVDVAQKYERKIGKEFQTEIRGQSRPPQSNQSTSLARSWNQNILTRFISWVRRLLGISSPDLPFPEKEEPNQVRLQTGPGGCRSQAECDAYCDKLENRDKCNQFAPPGK